MSATMTDRGYVTTPSVTAPVDVPVSVLRSAASKAATRQPFTSAERDARRDFPELYNRLRWAARVALSHR